MTVNCTSALALLGLLAGTEPAVGAPSVPDITLVTDMAGLTASPDGQSVAFRLEHAETSSNTYPAEWHVADLEKSRVRPVGSGGTAIFIDPGVPAAEAAVWSPDGRSIFYRALVDGEVQLWRAEADGTGAAPVLRDDADILSLRPTGDGKGIMVVTGPSRDAIRRAEAAEYDSGILVDQHVDLAQNVHRGAIVNGRPATQRLTGEWFARAGLLWREPLRERRLDMKSLVFAEAQMPRDAPEAKAGIGSSSSRAANGDVATASWSNRKGSVEVRRHGGSEVLRCSDPACGQRVAWLAWRPERDELVFAAEDDGLWHSLYRWDVRSGTVRLLVRAEGLLNGGRDLASPCAVTARQAICVAAEAASPPRLEQIDLETGTRALLFDPNAGLRARMSVTAERLQWKGAAGHVFTGVLLSPATLPAGRLPLFITYYRCEGFLRGGVGEEWPLAPLARAGFLSLCINNTPVAGPQDALANNKAAAEGIDAIVGSLHASGRIDRARVGMGGLSFGSEVTMWLAFNSDLLAAASISSPALEPAYYWLHGVRGRDNHDKLYQAWRLGDPEATPERWKILSAALNVDRIKAPILMQMPEQEVRVVPELYARLTNSATPAELYVFPDEPHIKVLPRHKVAAYQRNLDWFRFWLQGYVDPDPLKRAQYGRWADLETRRRASQPAAQARRQSSSVARSNRRK